MKTFFILTVFFIYVSIKTNRDILIQFLTRITNASSLSEIFIDPILNDAMKSLRRIETLLMILLNFSYD